MTAEASKPLSEQFDELLGQISSALLKDGHGQIRHILEMVRQALRAFERGGLDAFAPDQDPDKIRPHYIGMLRDWGVTWKNPWLYLRFFLLTLPKGIVKFRTWHLFRADLKIRATVHRHKLAARCMEIAAAIERL